MKWFPFSSKQVPKKVETISVGKIKTTSSDVTSETIKIFEKINKVAPSSFKMNKRPLYLAFGIICPLYLGHSFIFLYTENLSERYHSYLNNSLNFIATISATMIGIWAGNSLLSIDKKHIGSSSKTRPSYFLMKNRCFYSLGAFLCLSLALRLKESCLFKEYSVVPIFLTSLFTYSIFSNGVKINFFPGQLGRTYSTICSSLTIFSGIYAIYFFSERKNETRFYQQLRNRILLHTNENKLELKYLKLE